MTVVTGRRIIALVPDAYGGRGGIALYLRNFIRALASHPEVARIDVAPRRIEYELEPMPDVVRHVETAANGKISYVITVAGMMFGGPVDLVVCGHLHLLPLAKALAIRFGCPLVPIIYGYEAWNPTPHRLANRISRDLSTLISIRQMTANRFRAWSGARPRNYYYLPNCIEPAMYGAASKNAVLLERYGLTDRRVIMTTGRLDNDTREHRKGFDEVLEALPHITRDIPDVAYLIMGDGADRPRLEAKATALGVQDLVRFTGYVREAEKADHFRLADVFAMPGSNPSFDTYAFRFVFLEALASGVPVVGARLSDPTEVDDPDANALVHQTDTTDSVAVAETIKRVLIAAPGVPQANLENFYYPGFERRVHDILSDMFGSQ